MLTDQRVAVLVDCDNATPAVLEYVMEHASACGRVVFKRAYGNHATLANRWKDALLQLGFAPHLQFQYVAGKNTADIALALDALEALLDRRADCFFVVTSDSDFVYLCHKLRERGAAVHVVGEEKTPDALRAACDRFFEFAPVEPAQAAPVLPASASVARKPPPLVLDAVSRLAAATPDGRVHLGALGNYLREAAPGFTSKEYGYPKLIDLLRACSSFELHDQGGQAWTVRLAQGCKRKAA